MEQKGINKMKSFSSHPTLAKTFFGICAASVFALASAQAVVVTWDFNSGNQNGNAGSSSLTFTQSGYSLTVRGYDETSSSGPDTPRELYYKNEPMNGGAFERGLGLRGTPSNELTLDGNGNVANYLQLDLRAILSQGFTNGMIQVASLQPGEGYILFGSNSVGVRGTQLPGSYTGLGFDNQFVAIPDFGTYQFITVAAASGRVLPVAFRASITPIPEMNALFPIVGLLVAVSSTQILRRRRAAQLSDPKA